MLRIGSTGIISVIKKGHKNISAGKLTKNY
jgi:hypothetical protein